MQPRGRDWRDLLRRIWAPIAALGAFLAKFGGVLLKGKFFFSIFVSAALYIWYGGWTFGIALVALLFVHEMGHVLEAKRQGLPVSAPTFIPFLGAFITMRDMPKDAWREARVALAGPLVGTAGAAVLWAIGSAYDSYDLRAMAFIGFLLNLFNLMPAPPLDGGRAVAALHPAVWGFGVLGLVALAVLRPNPIIFIIAILSAAELYRRWQLRGLVTTRDYYRVAPWQRATVAAVYFGLAAALVLAMHETHIPTSYF